MPSGEVRFLFTGCSWALAGVVCGRTREASRPLTVAVVAGREFPETTGSAICFFLMASRLREHSHLLTNTFSSLKLTASV